MRGLVSQELVGFADERIHLQPLRIDVGHLAKEVNGLHRILMDQEISESEPRGEEAGGRSELLELEGSRRQGFDNLTGAVFRIAAFNRAAVILHGSFSILQYILAVKPSLHELPGIHRMVDAQQLIVNPSLEVKGIPNQVVGVALPGAGLIVLRPGFSVADPKGKGRDQESQRRQKLYFPSDHGAARSMVRSAEAMPRTFTRRSSMSFSSIRW